MTALDWVLVVAIVVLAAFVVVGLVLGARALRQLQSAKSEAKDRQDQVDDANAKAASVRAEAAAAKAEASAARAEARRILDAAHERGRHASSSAPTARPSRTPSRSAPPPGAAASARSPC